MASRYWVNNGGLWNDVSHWSTASGSTGGASVPTSVDSVYFDANSFSSTGQIVTVDVIANCLDMDWTGALYSPVLAGNQTLNVYGNFTLVTGMQITKTGSLFFYGSGNLTIDTKGVIIMSSPGFFGSGTRSLLGDFITTGSTTFFLGTFNSNNYNIKFSGINIYANRIFNFGMSIIESTLNLTFNSGNSSGVVFNGDYTWKFTGNAKTFNGGGLTYNNVEFLGTPTTITGSNTFNNLKLTAGKTVNFTAGTTQTINSLSGDGISGSLITIQSTVAGSPFTISKASGTLTKNYYSIKDCTATGGATFVAYNSTNVSGNTGWLYNVMFGNAINNILLTSLASATTYPKTIPSTIQQYFDALNSGILQPVARITFLHREDETPAFEIIGDIIDGSLNIKRTNGVRRSCSITLQNLTSSTDIINEYKIWVNSKFLLELGFKSENNIKTYYIKQGVFVVRNPQVVSFNSGSTITIDGIDKFSLLDGQLAGNLFATYKIPLNSDINTSIRAILNEYLDAPTNQIPIDAKDPILQTLSAGDTLTPYTIRSDIGNTYGDILLELNDLNSRNMFYNEEGHLVFEEDFDDSTKGSEWDFTEDEFIYLGSTHSYLFEQLYNKVIVIGNNANGKTYRGVATNINPQSNTNINIIGVKLAPIIEDSAINKTTLAQKRAEYELKRLNALQSEVSIESVPMFHLDVDKVITLTDSRLGLDISRFLITDISIPFSYNSSMTITAVKTDELVLGGA
jgi:hypothetical protein